MTFTYDSAGRMLSAVNDVNTLSWTYDDPGHPLSETSQRHSTALDYTYDIVGNRSSLRLRNTPYAVEYGYDTGSRLQSIHSPQGAADPFEFAFTYDAASRRKTLTHPNGIVTTYQYDEMDRLDSISAALGGTVVTSTAYEHDVSGNRTQKNTLDPSRSEKYAYDRLDRLVDSYRNATADRQVFAYDRVGNRTLQQINNVVLTAAYNDRNQLTAMSAGGRVPVTGTVNKPATVTINGEAATQLQGNRFEGAVDAAPGTNTISVEARDGNNATSVTQFSFTVDGSPGTFTYDLAGNLIEKTENGDAWRFEWDAENRLKRVLKNGTEATRFAYDPLGRRVEKGTPAATIGYVYDGPKIVREISSSVPDTAVYYVHSLAIDEHLMKQVMTTGGALVSRTYFHADGLGSVIATTDPAGTVTSTRQYDAWGNLDAGAGQPGYAFTGREWDPEIGLYYYRARYYDPKMGRFISEDPIGMGGSDVDLYAYVRNNAVRLSDPLGLEIYPPGGWSTFNPQRREPGDERLFKCYGKGFRQGAAAAVAIGAIAVGAAYVGVPAAVITTGLAAVTVLGTIVTGAEVGSALRSGNADRLMYLAGNIAGSAVAGAISGKFVAETTNRAPSPPWSLQSDWAQRYRRNFRFPDGTPGSPRKWFASGPNPGSAAGSMAMGGSGSASQQCGCE